MVEDPKTNNLMNMKSIFQTQETKQKTPFSILLFSQNEELNNSLVVREIKRESNVFLYNNLLFLVFCLYGLRRVVSKLFKHHKTTTTTK